MLIKQYNNIEKLFVISLIVIIPLYPKFPLFSVPGTYVAIRIEDLMIAFLALYLLFKYWTHIVYDINKPINMAFILFIVVGILSLLSSVLITNTTQSLLGFLHLIRRVQYITPFFLGYFAVKNKSISLGFILKTLTLVIICILIYGLGQKYLDWPIIVTQNREYAKGIALRSIPGGHLNSTFAGHYDLASYLILIIPIFLVYFSGKMDLKRIKAGDLVMMATVLFGTWLVGISGSRISTVSFMGAGVLSLLIIKKYKIIPLFIITSIVIFSLSTSLIARYNRLFEVGSNRIENIKEQLFSMSSAKLIYAQETENDFPEKRVRPSPTPTPPPVFEDRSTSIRLNIEWPRAIRAFKKNPLVGTGYSSITLATDNDYLRSIGEVGILGTLAFITIFFVIGQKLIGALRNLKLFNSTETAFIVGFVAALSGIFLNATFIDIFEASKFAITFWLIAGLVFGLVEIKLDEND